MWGLPFEAAPFDVIEFVDNFTYRGILAGLLLGSPGVPIPEFAAALSGRGRDRSPGRRTGE
jgi:hypothetical protein